MKFSQHHHHPLPETGTGMSAAEHNEHSERHSHEPEIPPTLDAEGRCLICGLLVQRDEAVAMATRLREALRSIAGKGRPSGEFCQRVAREALDV